MSDDVFARIRAACAEVAGRARHVRIAPEPLERLADELAAGPRTPPEQDPAHHRVGDDATTLAYVVTLDALNFGSGWFPHLAKRPGLSGYFTIATALKERFEREGPWSAAELAAFEAGECGRVFEQDLASPPVAELMELFARALRELGERIEQRHGGRFEALVAGAEGSAARLVDELAELSFYRDVSRYEELEVPLFKRAQLTAADLSSAFRGEGPGRFRDLDHLTIFADNLVPHVLRCEDVLVYTDALARRIDAEEPIPAGSPEEVEIRAVAVHAVERCVDRARERGVDLTARELDSVLWTRGHRPDMKARPRHRTRCTFY